MSEKYDMSMTSIIMDGCLQTPKCMSNLRRAPFDADVLATTKSTWPVSHLAPFGTCCEVLGSHFVQGLTYQSFQYYS